MKTQQEKKTFKDKNRDIINHKPCAEKESTQKRKNYEVFFFIYFRIQPHIKKYRKRHNKSHDMSTHHHRDINTILDNTKVEGFPIYTQVNNIFFFIYFSGF